MSPIQTTYSERIPVAYEGAIADETTADRDTRICETTAGINFGRAVSQGTGDKEAVLGGALAGFVGVTVRDPTLPSANADKYVRYDLMAVVFRGDVWVKPSVQVAAGDPVHYVSATGVFTNTGDIGPIIGATYMTSAAANGLAKIRLSGGMPA